MADENNQKVTKTDTAESNEHVPTPMYDTRVPDAIDNFLFLMLVVGFLVVAVVIGALLILLTGFWGVALLGVIGGTFGVGLWGIGHGRLPWQATQRLT